MDDLGEVPVEISLGDVAGGSTPQGPRCDLLAAVRCHEDDWNCRVSFPDSLDQGHSVHPGHLQVRHHEIREPLLQRIQSGATIAGEIDVDAGILEQESDSRGLRGAILDNEYARHQ
jgi:hypothetical protein